MKWVLNNFILIMILILLTVWAKPVIADSTNDDNTQTNTSGSNTQITGGYQSTTTNNNDGQTNTTTNTTTNLNTERTPIKTKMDSYQPEGEVVNEEESQNPTFTQFMKRIDQLPEVTREAIKNCGNDPMIAKAALEISGIDK